MPRKTLVWDGLLRRKKRRGAIYGKLFEHSTVGINRGGELHTIPSKDFVVGSKNFTVTHLTRADFKQMQQKLGLRTPNPTIKKRKH